MNVEGRQSVGTSPVSRCSVQSNTLTYSRLTNREPLIAPGSIPARGGGGGVMFPSVIPATATHLCKVMVGKKKKAKSDKVFVIYFRLFKCF